MSAAQGGALPTPATFGERAADLAYASGWSMVKALPGPVAEGLFRRAGDLAYRRQGAGVRRLRRNLRRVVGPGVTEAELDRLTHEGIRSYARYWLETFRLPVMPREMVVSRTDRYIQGAEHVDKAHAAGKGAVIVLPHMGNYDIAGVWLIDRGIPFTTVMERLKPDSLYTRFIAYREKLGMEVLPLTGGAQAPAEILLERLRAGRIICLVSDRDLTEAGVEVDFFGERAKMPAGPAYLAMRSGAPLLPASLWFEPDGWGVRIRPPLELPTEGSLRDRIQAVTQQIANCFAEDIAEHPTDWHMLQRLWLADLPRPAGPSGRLPGAGAAGTDAG